MGTLAGAPSGRPRRSCSRGLGPRRSPVLEGVLLAGWAVALGWPLRACVGASVRPARSPPARLLLGAFAGALVALASAAGRRLATRVGERLRANRVAWNSGKSREILPADGMSPT